MAIRQAVLFLVTIFCLVDFSSSFTSISSDNSIPHGNITETAILRKAAEACRDIAASEGRNFTLNIDSSLSADDVQRACSTNPSSSPISSVNFQTSISLIILHNAKVDFDFEQSEEYHFYNEAFQGGRDVITAGVAAVKTLLREGNYVAGRRTLGQVLHILQDFYIHSNWVELGKNAPYSVLIRPDEPLTNLAGPNTPTCRNCTGDNCTDNLLPDVLQQDLLTSGYFSILSSAKPPGKCSHGGPFDLTSTQDPVGGISKDNPGSSHGFLHEKAAALALDATIELLEDIRLAVGDKTFLRFMGLSQSNVLCFVIDTTGSMSDDILEANLVTENIIKNRRGTQQEPSAYILVPFNDPDFGPVTMTTNADVFKARLESLSANGGGDNPEMAFSGLRLALTAAPPSSEIFVFTDAPAKDIQLKSTIAALIESTKSVVTFLLTGSSSRRRRHVFRRSLTQSDVQLYRELAEASGGQAIEVTKSTLFEVVNVIEDSSTSAVVTVFQVVRNPGRPDKFSFIVDGSLTNMIAYITGASSLTFSLTNPTGASQSSSQSSGSLGSFTTTGNFRRLSLNTENQIGLWSISVSSNDAYSVRITGRSSLNFIYNLVEEEKRAHGDFSIKEGRILTGSNASVLIFVTGSVTARITEVSLIDSSGLIRVNGSSQPIGSNVHLARFPETPEGEFVLLLKAEDSSSVTRSTPSIFQRQGTTQIRTSSISATSQASVGIIEPGSNVSIPFTVAINANDSATGTFTVRANNDRGFVSSSPSTVTVEAGSGGKANGTVTLTVPASAASGTDVTLTIEAQNAAGTDINFTILRFSVAARVTDIARPEFQDVRISANCSSFNLPLCASSRWELTANITDRINGSGIASITVRQGDGNLTLTVVQAGGESITEATYRAFCCSQSVTLVAVDRVGNVGTLTRQLTQSSTAAPVTTAATTEVPTTTTVTTAAPAPTNVTTAAPAPANVTTAAPAPTNVTTAAPAPANVTTAAPAPANVTTAAPAPANVTTAAPAPSNVTTAAPAPTNVTTAAPAPSNVTTAAPAPASVTTAAPAPTIVGVGATAAPLTTLITTTASASANVLQFLFLDINGTGQVTRGISKSSLTLTGNTTGLNVISIATTAEVNMTMISTACPTITADTPGTVTNISTFDPVTEKCSTNVTTSAFMKAFIVTISTNETTPVTFSVTMASDVKIGFSPDLIISSHTTTVHIIMFFTIAVPITTTISLLQGYL